MEINSMNELLISVKTIDYLYNRKWHFGCIFVYRL